MTGKILDFARPVNGVVIQQRRSDGFINATAMAVAHGKNIADWFRTQDSFEYLTAFADDLGVEINYGISHNSSIMSISAAYPTLVISKRGSPDNGGGTWVYPDIAIKVAQWCNKPFEIQVIRWIKEWLTTGKNPIQVDVDQIAIEFYLCSSSFKKLTINCRRFVNQLIMLLIPPLHTT